jgi:sulfur carrier protein ThiS
MEVEFKEAILAVIRVQVALYGALAKYGGKRHVAQLDVELAEGSTKADLLTKLGVPEEERGYLFVNAVLHEVPGLTTHGPEPLQDGDHIGVFSIQHMYPYQYRDGIPMSPSLREAMKTHGAMHHVYKEES